MSISPKKTLAKPDARCGATFLERTSNGRCGFRHSRPCLVLFEPHRLSVKARAALTEAEADPGVIYVPSSVVVEVRYLVEKGTITEDTFQELVTSLLDDTTAPTVIPLGLDVARSLAQVPKILVPDMPDRIIAATALYLDLPLITRDRKIQASNIQSIW